MSAIAEIHPAAAAPPLFAGLSGDVSVSFEFFPPKTDAAADQLQATIDSLASCAPKFVSVTYGAGGTTQDRTISTVERILTQSQLAVASHLTCVGASKNDVDRVAEGLWSIGVRHVVALRGDGASLEAQFEPHPQGYRNAAELVAGLRRIAPFEISVAAYPEVHPDAPSPEADLDNLKRKVDAGADRALTQFFFSPDTFLRFRDRAAAAGISVPIVPGILPITNFDQTRRFASACGAEVPTWMEPVFSGLDQHPETRQLVAATLAAEFCCKLYAGGVREFHFYTLNRPELTKAICHLLGKRVPAQERQAA
jgi:methylenetetrahydrofolate reductase (NADPH)